MAKRPVFLPAAQPPFVEEQETIFQYFSGFAHSQKQKSIHSLHAAFCEQQGEAQKILEISSYSDTPLGAALSAFHLTLTLQDGSTTTVESAFQASKIFAGGVVCDDLLYASSKDAKKDQRLRTSGELVRFSFQGRDYPLEPTNFFYNWLYCRSVYREHRELYEELCRYDAFTDIVFNPSKSLNCQARAAAQLVGLRNANKLDVAMESPEAFLSVAYPKSARLGEQMNFLE